MVSNFRVAMEMLDIFDPDDPDANVDCCMNTVDRLGEVRGWLGHEKAYFAQAKLRGEARAWFHRRDYYALHGKSAARR